MAEWGMFFKYRKFIHKKKPHKQHTTIDIICRNMGKKTFTGLFTFLLLLFD